MTEYLIAQVWLIFQPVAVPNWTPLLYVEFFNFSNMHYAMVNNTRVVSLAVKSGSSGLKSDRGSSREIEVSYRGGPEV